MLVFNFFYFLNCNLINDIEYVFDIYNYLLNSILIENENFILFYNKYKFVDFYYYMYTHLYFIYRILKKISLFIYFNLLKLYIIFMNDTLFFNLNNNLFILLFKFKKWFIYNIKISNRTYFKFRKKYKYYYRFGQVDYLRVFFFLIIFWLLILMWKNRTTYYKIYFFLYPILFYVLVLYLCSIIVAFFYYKFVGVFLVFFIVFFFFLLKWLN